jgi:putative hemolysin
VSRKWSRVLIVLVAAILLISACQPSPEESPPEEPVGVANPASVYCEQLGYLLEIREDEDGGEFGVCIFPDMTECDEWAFYRAECGQHWSYCVQQGHTLRVRDEEVLCVFSDGSSCPEIDFLNGECGPEPEEQTE